MSTTSTVNFALAARATATTQRSAAPQPAGKTLAAIAKHVLDVTPILPALAVVTSLVLLTGVYSTLSAGGLG